MLKRKDEGKLVARLKQVEESRQAYRISCRHTARGCSFLDFLERKEPSKVK